MGRPRPVGRHQVLGHPLHQDGADRPGRRPAVGGVHGEGVQAVHAGDHPVLRPRGRRGGAGVDRGGMSGAARAASPNNRSNSMSRSLGRPFLWMLAALLCLLVLIPADRNTVGGRVLAGVLFTTAYLAGFAVVFKRPRQLTAGLLTGVPALVVVWAGIAVAPPPPLPLTVAGHVLSILFLAVTTTVILKAVGRLAEVTTDAVAGALCGYLLMGVGFGHAYSLIEGLAPGSFV